MSKRGNLMMKDKKLIIAIFLFSFVIVPFVMNAATAERKGDKKKEQIQRTVTNNFDLQFNTVSNFSFPVTNYGILFLDVARNVGGGYWPRGSLNQYFFGGGIWFGARKWIPADSLDPTTGDTIRYRRLNKLVELSYNPNSGLSWMVPGRIDDGDLIDNEDIKKYRVYFSTDFRTSDGKPINPDDGPAWPIWDASKNEDDELMVDRYFGYYISDPNLRTLENYPKGPAFISGEDIFSTFKDTDLNYYEKGVQFRKNLGYPMKLQFEQYIYSWGYGDYKDFIFLRYDIINYSNDTLYDCWLAPVMDVDIARAPNTAAGAANDFARFYDEDPALNLAVQWTRDDPMEKGYGFGYLGFDFLESPAVYQCESLIDTIINGNVESWCTMCTKDSTVVVTDPGGTNPRDSVFCVERIAFPKELVDYPRKDKKFYENKYQLGLRTFKRWPINEDLDNDDARYDNISSQVIEEGQGEAGDYRFLMATGPFNMMPRDTVRTVVGIILSSPAVFPDANGSTEDLVELVRKDKFAQRVYDNNFQAPRPPDKSIIYRWDPLNSAIKLVWDSSAEMSNDKYERGLDFMGFRLYRARRVDLDTFDVDNVSPSFEYSSGKGPFGWKQIAQWEIPTPFYKTKLRAGGDQDNQNMPFIDSLNIIGPIFERNEKGELVIDTFGIKIMRMAKGLIVFDPMSFVMKYMRPITEQIYPQRKWTYDGVYNVFIYDIDTNLISYPWGKFLKKYTKKGDFPLWFDPYNPEDPKNNHWLLKNVLVGEIRLNKAYLDYNPLFWKRVTVVLDDAVDTASFPDGVDPVTKIKYLKDTYRRINVDGRMRLAVDQLQPIPIMEAMKDSVIIKQALDSIYNYILNGKATINFPDFEGLEEVRKDVITEYMKEITRGNSFVDIGDDNWSGNITFDENPVKTEKLINNVPYYYKLLAYDEGDYTQPTPRKLNSGFVGLPNVKEVFPRAARVMKQPEFKVTYVDTARIGGLYNFKFFAYDPDRAQQLFSGHTLELEFTPSWYFTRVLIQKKIGAQGETTVSKSVPVSLYRSLMTLKDKTDNDKILFQGYTFLEQTSGSIPFRGSFTENAQSWVFDYEPVKDTVRNIMINMALPAYDTVVTRSSMITTGDFKTPGYSYAMGFLPPAYGTIGFSFNYTAQQFGGVYRPDSSSIYPPVKGNPSPIIDNSFRVPINFMTDTHDEITKTFDSAKVVYRVQNVGLNVLGLGFLSNETTGQFGVVPRYGTTLYGSFNNGPADYLIEFKPGGKDTLQLWTKELKTTKTFICDYLTMEVSNKIKFKRPNLKGGDSIEVTYPLPIEHLEIELTDDYKYPFPPNLNTRYVDLIGKYNLSSYGFINASSKDGLKLPRKLAVSSNISESEYDDLANKRIAIGKQGRFYLNAVSIDGQDTLRFINAFMGSGVTFVFDLAKIERLEATATRQWTLTDEAKSMEMIMPKPGDKVRLRTNGGALGFPLPGAKVIVSIDSVDYDNAKYSDDMMDEIRIVPNPYYITHQAQASPYDGKIYFTRLPKRATINIYTITGDLVRTIEHDEFTSPEPNKATAEVWDLLTKNRQRVQSQTFVAVITTPDGAQTVQKFSVVVGGFRLVPETE